MKQLNGTVPKASAVGVKVGAPVVGSSVGLNEGAADGLRLGCMDDHSVAVVGTRVGAGLRRAVGVKEG